MLSLFNKTTASVIAGAALMTSAFGGKISPTPTVSVPPQPPSPVMTTDFVRITAPWIAIPIESAPLTCEVGKYVMLIQENDEFFITMCSNEYEGVFLAAFPVNTRDGRPAWTTPERKVIFAYRTSSCRGKMYLRRGDELPIDAETRSDYKLKFERFDHAFPLYLCKTNCGIEFVKAIPLTPTQIAAAKTARKTATASAPRPPPVKRYIITPVASSSNLLPLSTAVQKQSSATSGGNEKPKEERWFSQLFSHGDKTGPVTKKPKEAAIAKAESVQKTEPPVSAGADTNKAFAAASPSANSQTAAAKKTPQTGTPGLMSNLTNYRIPIIIIASLVLFIIGLYGKSRRKARRREVAMEAAAEALAAGAGGSGKPPPIPGSANDFSGSIASMSLGSVTQFLNSDKEMGTLHVKDKNNVEIGTLVFIQGEIIDAKSSDKRGIDALYEILRNKEGFFSFLREEPKNVEKTITRGTISLLLDAHRIMDEEHMPPVPVPPVAPTSSHSPVASHQTVPKAATKLKLHGSR